MSEILAPYYDIYLLLHQLIVETCSAVLAHHPPQVILRIKELELAVQTLHEKINYISETGL